MKKIFFLKLLLLFLTAFVAYSVSEEILAITILPARTSEKQNGPIKVHPNINATFQGGFSLCMRVKFLNWVSSTLIWSHYLSLSLNSEMHGEVSFNGGHMFYWNKNIPIDPTYWNSICITYNTASLYFNLSINGQDEVSTIKKNCSITATVKCT